VARSFSEFKRFVKKKIGDFSGKGTFPDLLLKIPLWDSVNTREKVGTNHSKQRLLGEQASPMLNR
jgi:hypothetical protein